VFVIDSCHYGVGEEERKGQIERALNPLPPLSSSSSPMGRGGGGSGVTWARCVRVGAGVAPSCSSVTGRVVEFPNKLGVDY
jgi:hypothetical protein